MQPAASLDRFPPQKGDFPILHPFHGSNPVLALYRVMVEG
jgi:hypothetical protein